jgi:hypothetical protein
MVMRAAERMEHAFAGHVLNALAVEELAERGVVAYAHDGSGDFEWEVQIADHPSEPGSSRRIRTKRDFQHWLIFLRDDVGGVVRLEKLRAIHERRFEIEAKLPAVIGDSTPAAFGECEAIDWNADDWPVASRDNCGMNEMHQPTA